MEDTETSEDEEEEDDKELDEKIEKKKQLADLKEDQFSKVHNEPEENLAPPGEQASHLMFRKNSTANNGLWEWLVRKLSLGKNASYDYQYGWFFAVTKNDPLNGVLVDYSWIQRNFHVSYIHALIANPGKYLMVPAGKARKRLRGARSLKS